MKTTSLTVSQNIQSLMTAANLGVNALGRKLHGRVSPATITKFTATPDEANPKLSTLIDIADTFRISPWMLLVPQFPYAAVSTQPLNEICADGYALLKIYQAAPDHMRKTILDYAAYQLRGQPQTETKIREVQAKYLVTNDGKYPRCNEDHS